MKPYEKYKTTDIAWLGDIPSHWEVKRLKYLAKIQTGNTPSRTNPDFFSDENGILWIKPEDLNGTNEITKTKEYLTELGKKEARLIPANSVLTCCIGSIGKTGIIRQEATTNQQINSLTFNTTSVNFEYAKYCIISLENEQDKFSNGNVVKILNTEKQGNIYLPLPPLPEQIAIANFLDKKTAQIKEAIALKSEQIIKLKEYRQTLINQTVTQGLNPTVAIKNSGVEWLGEIPSHWEVKKLKYVCKLFGRIGFRGYNSTDLTDEFNGSITLSPSNIDDGSINYTKCSYLSWEKYYQSPEIMVKEKDILIVKTGSSYGKIGYVDFLPKEATINPQLLVVKEISIESKFLFYLFLTKIVQNQINANVIGSTIPTISESKILDFKVTIPPLSEQTAIADFLDKKTSQIDTAISQYQAQIDKLKEYQQSLVGEVVTGKIQVEQNFL